MISNWSKFGYIVGILWSIGFAVRYLFIWQDYSQAVIFVSIGLVLVGFSWVYSKIRDIYNKLDGVEIYLADKK